MPPSAGVRSIPASVLKAVGWVESGWKQFTPSGRPLLSFDFGYGVMQITSGMAGAFGNARGSLNPDVQSQIASNSTYNIAYGARVLAEKWAATPKVGDGETSEVENWYYAIWAYNGWGWVNNPNNPRFTRQGTPATNPATYPYQERVLYLVAHPPKDGNGSFLWRPVPVTLPDRTAIGNTPKQIPALTSVHKQAPQVTDAIYRPDPLSPEPPDASQRVSVKVTNVGTGTWNGTEAVALTYHVMTGTANPWRSLSPFTPGVIAFGQGNVPITGNVLPGASRTVVVELASPGSPGQYQIVWDLSSRSSQFSSLGVLPRVEKLTVMENGRPLPAPTATATPSRDHPLDLEYVADTSMSDGQTVTAGDRFTKGWLVFNSGTAAWSTSLALNLVSGKPFGARHIPLPATAPCRAANLLVGMKAPSKAGRYRSVWQLAGSNGKRIGDPLTLVLTVSRKSGPQPTPSPPLPTPVQGKPTPSPTPEG